jgi:hypothetical protein
MRLVAAVAIHHPISSQPLAADGAIADGRLRVDHGLFRRAATTLSSAVTADDLVRLGAGNGGTTLTRTQQLDGLRASLATLTAALYRRGQEREPGSLDEAVRHAISVADDVASRLRQGFGAQGWWNPWAQR